MASFGNIFNNFLFLGLFVLGMFSIVILVQGDNNAAQPLGENALFNISYNQLRGNISEFESSSQTQYARFTDEDPKLGFGSIVLFGIVSAGKTFGTVTFQTFFIILQLPLIILGIDPSIVSVILIWLIISIIIGLWILYKLGG